MCAYRPLREGRGVTLKAEIEKLEVGVIFFFLELKEMSKGETGLWGWKKGRVRVSDPALR